MTEEPVAFQAYEQLAEAFAARVETKAWNAYYDRPAVLGLLPDVAGMRVLDAGCGPGAYAERLVARGAEVVAVDVSPKMVKLCRQRLGNKVDVREADITQPMSFLADGSFDIVVCPLVLGYVRDLRAVYHEFFRVLRPAGVLVFSDGHPFFDYQHYKSTNYFETELVGEEWRGFGIPVYVPCYRRSLGAIINPLIEEGFVLDLIHEPLPTEEFKKADPQDYEKLMNFPAFICIRAKKP
jgi:SAM-dependent methyltransferase